MGRSASKIFCLESEKFALGVKKKKDWLFLYTYSAIYMSFSAIRNFIIAKHIVLNIFWLLFVHDLLNISHANDDRNTFVCVWAMHITSLKYHLLFQSEKARWLLRYQPHFEKMSSTETFHIDKLSYYPFWVWWSKFFICFQKAITPLKKIRLDVAPPCPWQEWLKSYHLYLPVTFLLNICPFFIILFISSVW